MAACCQNLTLGALSSRSALSVLVGALFTKFSLFLKAPRICLFEIFNPLNAKLNPICHLLALLGAHHIIHVSGVRVNGQVSIYVLKVKVEKWSSP